MEEKLQKENSDLLPQQAINTGNDSNPEISSESSDKSFNIDKNLYDAPAEHNVVENLQENVTNEIEEQLQIKKSEEVNSETVDFKKIMRSYRRIAADKKQESRRREFYVSKGEQNREDKKNAIRNRNSNRFRSQKY